MPGLQPEIKQFPGAFIIGKRQEMSLINNPIQALWQGFLPLKDGITNRCTSDHIALVNYPEDYFQGFDPAKTFERWAAVEVDSLDDIPTDLEGLEIPPGEYAVFQYQGSSADPAIFQYIFSEWIPQSAYRIDHRPHFEVLGERYRNNDPLSEEEIWIPIAK